MICPNCETEYRDGFERCADCDVPLVEELAPEVGTALMVIYDGANMPIVTRLVDALEDEGIAYVIESGTALDLLDMTDEEAAAAGDAPREWRARVSVPASSADRAGDLLRDAHDSSVQEGLEAPPPGIISA